MVDGLENKTRAGSMVRDALGMEYRCISVGSYGIGHGWIKRRSVRRLLVQLCCREGSKYRCRHITRGNTVGLPQKCIPNIPDFFLP